MDKKNYDFASWLNEQKITRKIELIQLHHTYSPSYAQFNGGNHIEMHNNMKNYHVKVNKWADIGQNFTIFPDGVIVIGRDLNVAPAGIKGANSNGICIECVGNFDTGGDVMTEAQKNAIIAVVQAMLKKFGLKAENAVTYHSWWTASGTNLKDYVKGKSAKTCPGTNFFGGNTRKAFEENLLPLLKGGNTMTNQLKPIDTINDIIWELQNRKIITDTQLWTQKCAEDVNVYHLCRKVANYLRGTL